LLGLLVETSPITVNASAEAGDGALLGNVLTTALKTLDATPENLAELSTNINGILAKVVGHACYDPHAAVGAARARVSLRVAY
jgi:hypothetical protein